MIFHWCVLLFYSGIAATVLGICFSRAADFALFRVQPVYGLVIGLIAGTIAGLAALALALLFFCMPLMLLVSYLFYVRSLRLSPPGGK